MNPIIRNSIFQYLRNYGPQNVEFVLDHFAKQFHTTKQCISGNLSWMVCGEGRAYITGKAPNSIVH